MAQILHLNVSIKYSVFTHLNKMPGMINFKDIKTSTFQLKYIGNAQRDAFGSKALKAFTFKH